ncbi:MAG: peptide chain release factor 1 [Bdellovibrionales bacterium]|nr:peptide chain release factor 1 [Bdellovibrionales bacterium]
MKIFKKLNDIQSQYQKLEKRLQNISTSTNSPDEKTNLLKEYSSLGKIMKIYKEYQDVTNTIQSYKTLLLEEKEDQELILLAKEERDLLKIKQDRLILQLNQFLIPKDPLDDKNVIMEIRPAAGGNEASLFCQDLFAMYSYYAEKKKWKGEILSSSPGNSGGFKEMIFSISGSYVYENLKYESGVHRVQRVPKTETQGRVHTSTVTVVVLPSVEMEEVKINQTDIRVDTFRSSGAGGQHVNTTDSAIRVVHLPTKITVQCQDEKSQHANKEKALRVLYARLYDLEMQKKKEKESQTRLSQIGTGDRSEKVRTYNFPQSRITDHRAGITLYHLDQILAGDLDPLIDSVKVKMQNDF